MRSVNGALAHINDAIQKGETFKMGWCKRQCREAYLIPTDGSTDAREAYARTKHRFKDVWVRGAFIWWRNDGHWHVAICAWRKGHIRTVDYPTVGRWNRTTVTQLEQAWRSLEFVGFSLDIDGVQVRKFPRIIRRWSHK